MLLLASAVAGAQAVPPGTGQQPAADGRPVPVLLTLSALRDEDGYAHSMVSLTAGITPATWLSAALGRSLAPAAETDVSARLITLGIEHDFGPVGLALRREAWGDSDNLESADLRAEAFLERERFRVALVHEQRDIDIYFSAGGTAPTATDLRRIGIEAEGTGIDWRYRFTPLWRVYGSWMDYDYPRAMRLVPRADRLDLLSASAVTLAYSFVDRYQSLGVERTLAGSRLVNLDLARDRSTIDGRGVSSASVSLLLPVALRTDLELTLGSSDSSRLGSTSFGGLALYFYRGG